MKTSHVDGTEVEIPTLEELDEQGEDPHHKVSTREDFDLLVKAMGWDGTKHFEEKTGVTCDELLGVWWMTMHDRVYLR